MLSFTCLLSVYHRENPQYLGDCLASIEANSIVPNEVVLVVDGPIPDTLEERIAQFRQRLPLRSLRLRDNVGLARALNSGLEGVTTDWVARMDTDDLCEPTRFAQQLAFLERKPDTSIFGGNIAEFRDTPDAPYAVRRMPTEHAAIIAMLRRRSPLNHMTVMYRKSDVCGVGGYPDLHLKEDYGLWIRLAAAGARMGNTGTILVRARAGEALLRRRSGFDYLRSEVGLYTALRRSGFTTAIEGWQTLALRCLALSMPLSVKSVLYRRFLRDRPQDLTASLR